MLWPVAKSEIYKIFYKIGINGQWLRLERTAFLQSRENDLDLVLDFYFLDHAPVYFAFNYPWTYTENQKFIRDLHYEFAGDEEIYYNNEVLI